MDPLLASTVEIAKYLIDKHNVSTIIKDYDGHYLLHLAAINQKLDLVKFYIEGIKSDVNAIDVFGRTALHYFYINYILFRHSKFF